MKNQSGLNDFSVTATTAVSQQLESLSFHPCCKAEEVFDHRHKVKASKPLSADKRDFSKTAPPERAVTNSPCRGGVCAERGPEMGALPELCC